MIKKLSYSILITIGIAFVLTNSSVAQNLSQLELPEGAKGRLVKGSITIIQYSPDGTKLAVGSGIGIWIYDAHTGEELDLYTGHAGVVWSVSFSPDGNTIASGSYDETICLWNTHTGELIHTLTEHTDRVFSVSFSPDGNTLASGSDDGTIRFWNAHTGEHIKTLMSWGLHVLFSPDGNTFASVSGGDINLWNAHTYKHIKTLSGSGRYVSFSPDGNTIASCGYDSWVRLWNVHTGENIQTLRGHTGRVDSVSFSPDGNTLASGGNRVLLWEITPAVTNIFLPEDVNDDGIVDIADLVLVAADFGKTGENIADVNGDGEVNREDILAVLDVLEAQETADTAAAAAVSTAQSLQRWIDAAKQLNRRDTNFQKGIAVLERLLATWYEAQAVPKRTALLANYPNPFNPETWIPYQLAKSADVSISIYAVDGKLIRTLTLGHLAAGTYQSRNRAAYWDGKNAFGESVASGVYFYTLTAEDFSETRKMLIVK